MRCPSTAMTTPGRSSIGQPRSSGARRAGGAQPAGHLRARGCGRYVSAESALPLAVAGFLGRRLEVGGKSGAALSTPRAKVCGKSRLNCGETRRSPPRNATSRPPGPSKPVSHMSLSRAMFTARSDPSLVSGMLGCRGPPRRCQGAAQTHGAVLLPRGAPVTAVSRTPPYDARP